MEGYADVLKACDNLKRKNDLSGEQVAKILIKIKEFYMKEKKNG